MSDRTSDGKLIEVVLAEIQKDIKNLLSDMTELKSTQKDFNIDIAELMRTTLFNQFYEKEYTPLEIRVRGLEQTNARYAVVTGIITAILTVAGTIVIQRVFNLF